MKEARNEEPESMAVKDNQPIQIDSDRQPEAMQPVNKNNNASDNNNNNPADDNTNSNADDETNDTYAEGFRAESDAEGKGKP